MKTYTKEEADILIAYYTPKIIGNKVMKSLSDNYKITNLEVEYVEKNKALIFCIAKYNFDVFKRRLIEYTMEFDLLQPDEVLKSNNN